MDPLDSFDYLNGVSKEDYLASEVHQLVKSMAVEDLKEYFEKKLDAYKIAQKDINITMIGLKKVITSVYPETERKGIAIPYKKSGTDVPNNTPVDGLNKSEEPLKIEDVLSEEFNEAATVFQISSSKMLSSAERIKSIVQSLE